MTKQVQIVYSSSSSARLWQFQFFRETDRQRDLSSPENASTSNNSSTISRTRRTSEYVLDLISFELLFLGRHYFKNCFIQGSIDFIFGDGQSLYQVNN
jgi:hypothetical protein